jgi:tetratricopeptide (TPR) repeat protein
VLSSEKHTDDARKLFARAAQAEKALGYHEPPSYICPVGENEAAALMAVGDWTGAKAAYQRALSERPRSGFPLYGIAMSSESAGDSAAAAKEYQEFLAAWTDADPDLPQVAHAQKYLAEHQAITVAPTEAEWMVVDDPESCNVNSVLPTTSSPDLRTKPR